MAAPDQPPDHADDDTTTRRTYFGRNGSPEITVAFPFSKVELVRTDDAVRAAAIAALDAVASLAASVEALALAPTKADRQQIADDVGLLRGELEELVTGLASSTEH